MTSRLSRLLRPRTVAIVGASERRLRSNNAARAMIASGVDLKLVNPKGEMLYGRQSYRSLEEIGAPVDAAFILTNASTAIEVAAEAARLGVGGVVVNADGFSEAGAAGAELQRRLTEAAGAMPLLGPNCNGYIAPGLGLHLSGAPPYPMRAGSIAFVTHSGATILPMGIGGEERAMGFSQLVSTGNEAAVDMADCIDFFAEDDDTRAICLLIEAIRRPGPFFVAVGRAIAAGKPILALKNGRSARGKAIAQSHTGAIAGEAWIYEAALRQHGVILANDLVELMDRAVLFDQVPRQRWTAVSGLAVAAGSGGYVTMASDVCAEEGVALPALEGLAEPLRPIIPTISVVNPLDLTGAAMSDPSIMRAVLSQFAGSDEVDALLVQCPVVDGLEALADVYVQPAAEVARETGILTVIGSIEGGAIGTTMRGFIGEGVAVTRGLRATLRAIRTMSDFMTWTPRDAAAAPPVELRPRPEGALDHAQAGLMLGFADAMALLEAYDLPVAPCRMVPGDTDVDTIQVGFPAPYVVKLADVPHRSDLGAVKLNVGQGALEPVIEELRALAGRAGESPVVVIQPHERFSAELFVGVHSTPLGPVIVCGLGGIFVEIIGRAAGRLAPVGRAEARSMIDEINIGSILTGARGRPSWDVERLCDLLVATSRLALEAEPWLASLDLNPIGLTPDGMVAVDALFLLRDGVPAAPGAHAVLSPHQNAPVGN